MNRLCIALVLVAFGTPSIRAAEPPKEVEFYQIWWTVKGKGLHFYGEIATKDKADKLAGALRKYPRKPTVEVRGPYKRKLAAAKVALNKTKLQKQLILHEDKRTKAYKDSKGILTIGVGLNLTRPDAKKKITDLGYDWEKIKSGDQELKDEDILKLLDDDIKTAINNAKLLFPDLETYDEVRQRVLIDMMFNMGLGTFSKFKDTIALIKAQEWDKAAEAMKESLWYTQVGNRGKRLVEMMKTGKDHADLIKVFNAR